MGYMAYLEDVAWGVTRGVATGETIQCGVHGVFRGRG